MIYTFIISVCIHEVICSPWRFAQAFPNSLLHELCLPGDSDHYFTIPMQLDRNIQPTQGQKLSIKEFGFTVRMSRKYIRFRTEFLWYSNYINFRVKFVFFFSRPLLPTPVSRFSVEVCNSFWSHWETHHSRQDSSGRGIGSSQRPLPDNNTQHSQETSIHAPGGIFFLPVRGFFPLIHFFCTV
jgi:hypothetical protein